MKLGAIIFSAVLLVAYVAASEVKSDVKELTPDNFDSVIDGSKHAFVEFYAPWCGHCKNLAPEYELVGTAFAKIDEVIVAKVDADKHKDLASRFNVRGYPTLKFFPKGSTEPQDYNGGRTAQDIVNYINEKAGTNARVITPPSDVVTLTPDNFDKIVKDSSKHVFVEFFAPWCGHCKKLKPTWEQLATAFKAEDKVVIAAIDADKHKDIAAKYEVSGFPTLKWFAADNKEPEKYEGGRTIEDLLAFVNKKAGTKRKADGRLDSTFGLVQSLTDIGKQLVADTSASEKLLKQAEEIVATLHGAEAQYGKLYVKLLNAVAKNGAEYVDKEIGRLERMLQGAVSLKKADEFVHRINILKSFKN